ncbi:hypothetical protein [Caenispirillum bisanense]|uniref:Nif11 domain-containing protein n=1 Tax=Caenispirillum bisanense TaxID=414052 RepID=A0A286GEF4_9PROT|nr:hypothetical protein [Caenispirillum bisanense]SOD93880.1 hypothetical protein SAMN05421508_103245 [Caenispirillum bisanense]
MSVRELERFARDMHGNDAIYRAALQAGAVCRTVTELVAFLQGLGYDVRPHDLREAQGAHALPSPPPCEAAVPIVAWSTA